MSAQAAAPATAAPTRAAGLGVLLAACVSTFVVNANTSAVTILLPAISKDVGTSVDTLQWAVTGYSLVGAAVAGLYPCMCATASDHSQRSSVLKYRNEPTRSRTRGAPCPFVAAR